MTFENTNLEKGKVKLCSILPESPSICVSLITHKKRVEIGYLLNLEKLL